MMKNLFTPLAAITTGAMADPGCVDATAITANGVMQPGPVGSSQVMTGVVVDRFCVDQGFAIDNAELWMDERPFEHTAKCIVDPPQCPASGYCLMQFEAPKAKWRCVHNFSATQTMALKDWLDANRVQYPIGGRVALTGEWTAEEFVVDIPSIERLSDVPFTCESAAGSTGSEVCNIPTANGLIELGPVGETQTLLGVVADRWCVDKPDNIGIDGTNMLHNADQHTIHCLVDIPECYMNGYCLMRQNTAREWNCVYNFTQEETLKLKAFYEQHRNRVVAQPVNLVGTWSQNAASGEVDFIVDSTASNFDCNPPVIDMGENNTLQITLAILLTMIFLMLVLGCLCVCCKSYMARKNQTYAKMLAVTKSGTPQSTRSPIAAEDQQYQQQEPEPFSPANSDLMEEYKAQPEFADL